MFDFWPYKEVKEVVWTSIRNESFSQNALTTELQETLGELGHFTRFICDNRPA